MRTIDKLKEYDLSDRDEILLAQNWWYNWCWWKDWYDFSKTIRWNIKLISNFNPNLSMQLWEDIEKICLDHDIDFSRWGGLFHFYRANFVFGYKLFKLLHKLKLGGRISVSSISIVLLNRYWKDYFKFWEKRSLKYLLNNKCIW